MEGLQKSDRQVRTIVRKLEELGLLVKVADACEHEATEYRMNTLAVPRKPEYKPKPRRRRSEAQTSDLNHAQGEAQTSDLKAQPAQTPGRKFQTSGRKFQTFRAEAQTSA